MYVGIFDRLTFLQVTRNMVLLLLFNHTQMSIVEGSSFIRSVPLDGRGRPHVFCDLVYIP